MAERHGQDSADAQACEREPLAFSGRIQDVGALFGVAPGSDALVCLSDNARRWFELPEDRSALRLKTLFRDDSDYFRYRRRSIFARHHFVVRNVLSNLGVEGDLLISEHSRLHLYEFEPKLEARCLAHSQALRAPVERDAKTLHEELGIDTLLRRIHALTGYPKVMLYRFLDDGCGEVVAELSDRSLDSYQGLRFPASDIPRIARKLYIDNPLRLIFDTRGRESAVHSLCAHSVDLSYSGLRSVSPLHIEYLGNMGVRSSASLPVRVLGRLWGLVALHAVQPTPIPVEQRLALLRLVEQDLSRRLMDAHIKGEHRRFNASAERLREGAQRLALALRGDADRARDDPRPALYPLIDCDELLVRANGRLLGRARLIGAQELDAIAAVARVQALRGQFSTDALHRFLNQDEDFRRRVSGLLYASTAIASAGDRLELFWLRSEQAQSVTWAGKPQKVRRDVDGVERISPRRSFAAWSAETAGQSAAWDSSDLMIASKLVVQVMGLRRAMT